MYKPIVSIAAVALTFYAFVPYIRSIRQGQTKPHVFSWVIWGFTTFIVFFAQLAGKAGIGAWPIGVSGLISLYIAFLAYRLRTDVHISKLDWTFFIVATLTLPLWFFTQDPLWAVIILTFVDVVGFGPTYRRAMAHPHQERLGFFSLFVIRNAMAIVALEHYTLTTVLFPAAIGAACFFLVIMVAIRRRAMPR